MFNKKICQTSVVVILFTSLGLILPRETVADVIPAGHKSVKHQLVFQESDLFKNHRLIAAPISGFSGAETIKPGQPFVFSSKYGTRFYIVPEGVEVPKFDREVFEQWPHSRPPIGEIRSVPVVSPVSSALTTLSFDQVDEQGQPVISKVAHLELDSSGNEASVVRSYTGIAIVMIVGLIICALAIRKLMGSRSAKTHEPAEAAVS